MLHDPVGLAYAAAAVVFGWIARLTWARRAHNPALASSLVVVMLGLGASCVANAIAVSSANEQTAAIATLAILPTAGIAAGAFFCLGLSCAQPQWRAHRTLLLWLLIEPVAITAAVVTNRWHEWVYAGPGATDLTGSAAWLHGSAYWSHTGYCYAMFGAGCVLIAWGWWTAPAPFRRQRLAFLLAALIPIAANVAYIASGFDEDVDPTPFGFAVTGAIMAYAIFRQELFTLSPVARALIVDQIGDAVMVVNPAGRIVDLNITACALVRAVHPQAPDDLIGLSAEGYCGEAHGSDQSSTELVVDLPGGRTEFQVRSSPLLDRRGRLLGEVLVARDVTEAHAQERRLIAANTRLIAQVETIDRLRADLVELSSRDPLTGLHNRRYMVDQFGQMVTAAERTGEPLAVVLLDIDRFKAINDVHGHLAGDDALVALAQRIRARAPADALVARWGGEEFFVALPGTDGACGLAFADDVRSLCAQDGLPIAGQAIPCTLSGGVATYPESGVTPNELFHGADLALFEAKDAGRNTVRLHVRFTGPTLDSLLPQT
ncbi:histidine kinase N-terminal 7TM domain-containing diguanylate cyclase [Pengzhenrongella frigida]|uniref:histidine kinase N-terminal 7TM domain-containing diguanylate cyclase n=1 Tax=Pengzhenrongella frigida TaxID=1259133 RepID=UPI0013ED6D2E|nr:diguanylate cyclase [Cellulomonas sp. HLT2-17]